MAAEKTALRGGKGGFASLVVSFDEPAARHVCSIDGVLRVNKTSATCTVIKPKSPPLGNTVFSVGFLSSASAMLGPRAHNRIHYPPPSLGKRSGFTASAWGGEGLPSLNPTALSRTRTSLCTF